ncbi:MAG: S-methyl-5-thioribose-1-phosphate isomerase [Chlamydiales bacterium]|nr:S-methyl-5-thioribose-1-phosphate isomerase [Chlamydiales bacterium]
MKEFTSLGLRYIEGRLEVLDQRLLPQEEVWRVVQHPREMERLIKQLSLRGAPLIGVGAAVALALYAQRGASTEEIFEAGHLLREARPTAVNLMVAIDALLEKSDNIPELISTAEQIIETEIARTESIANYGASLINDGDGILTHCNTGGLATVGIGTALGAIRRAVEQGKEVHVYVAETRPLLQGARLTCWELGRLNIAHTLICDNMSAVILRQGRAQRVLVGADRIALNGDFAYKVGTYGLAVLARHHDVPFHPVAPTSTIDFSCMKGTHIPIEERPADEVRGAKGFFGDVRWSPPAVDVFNPSFDVTPVELVTSMILDTGIYSNNQLSRDVLKTLNREVLICEN